MPDNWEQIADQLADAIRLTREYVEPTVSLPPIGGWSWFDALEAYRAAKGWEWYDVPPPSHVAPPSVVDLDERSLAELWAQAGLETGVVGVQASSRERADRYRELLREHGHLMPADHPDAGGRNLPCGWPGERASDLGGRSPLNEMLDHAAVANEGSSEVVVLPRAALFEFLAWCALPPYPPDDGTLPARLAEWVEGNKL